MQRYRAFLEYFGPAFHGWQRQKSGVLSVQECLEAAATKFCGKPVTVVGAGRTDAGVHAVGQAAHFDLPIRINSVQREADAPHKVLKGLNSHLAHVPLSVTRVDLVPPHFHARFHAIEREYVYMVVNSVDRKSPVLLHNRAWWYRLPLDVARMRAAAQHMLGTHDWSSFRSSDCESRRTMRTLAALEVHEGRPPPPFGSVMVGDPGAKVYTFVVRSRAFLRSQVRMIVATLVQIGCGHLEPDVVPRLLAARDCRSLPTPNTAPPEGLYLTSVRYGEPDTWVVVPEGEAEMDESD